MIKSNRFNEHSTFQTQKIRFWTEKEEKKKNETKEDKNGFNSNFVCRCRLLMVGWWLSLKNFESDDSSRISIDEFLILKFVGDFLCLLSNLWVIHFYTILIYSICSLDRMYDECRNWTIDWCSVFVCLCVFVFVLSVSIAWSHCFSFCI